MTFRISDLLIRGCLIIIGLTEVAHLAGCLLGWSFLAVTELLLADKHVAVVPGNAFEAEGFCRLSYAVAMESCMEGLRRIEEFVSELK
jgi:DNA-binding transcriptional MocR family regulator